MVEALTGQLRESVRVASEEVEEFVNAAVEKLKKKPATMEEMNAAQGEYFELKAQKKAKERLLEDARQKNKLLRNLVGLAHNLQNVEKRWENFEVAIGDFDSILAEQTERMKADVGRRA